MIVMLWEKCCDYGDWSAWISSKFSSEWRVNNYFGIKNGIIMSLFLED